MQAQGPAIIDIVAASLGDNGGQPTDRRWIPLRFSSILGDQDHSDFDPFVVGRPITASNGTIYVIAGVLRPTELKDIFELD